MRRPALAFVLAGLLGALPLGAHGQAPSRARTSAASWTPPRLPWGDPDIQGLFTSDDESTVPFERTAELGTRAVLTDQEFAARQRQAAQQADADNADFDLDDITPEVVARGAVGGPVSPPPHWLERGLPSRRASLVVDPPDGRIPFLSPDVRQAAARSARGGGQRIYNGPEDLDLYNRCITRGVPGVMFPTIYNNYSSIVQGPGYVAITYEMIHDARIIPLDGRPHVSTEIRLYMGDARGRWEGNTLVVETTNLQTGFRGSNPATSRVIERFTRIGPGTVRYGMTFEDPTTFSRPWTMLIYLRQDDRQPGVFEYACHEGNYAMGNILSGARAEERAAAAAARGE